MVAFKSIITFIDVCSQAMVRPSLRDVNAATCFALPGLNLGVQVRGESMAHLPCRPGAKLDE